MALADDLAAARVVTIDHAGTDVLRVSTFPPIGGIDRRFSGCRAFDDALTFASKAAAGLGYRLDDRTGRCDPAMCRLMVVMAEDGAEIVSLASRR